MLWEFLWRWNSWSTWWVNLTLLLPVHWRLAIDCFCNNIGPNMMIMEHNLSFYLSHNKIIQVLIWEMKQHSQSVSSVILSLIDMISWFFYKWPQQQYFLWWHSPNDDFDIKKDMIVQVMWIEMVCLPLNNTIFENGG